ncbi:hypothetical protein PsAD46_01365 [Pseudovibrio sp. Ad46]|nr:hypothetical protein PsAD46_01365 [Pseudovibrio sp. Ad46]
MQLAPDFILSIEYTVVISAAAFPFIKSCQGLKVGCTIPIKPLTQNQLLGLVDLAVSFTARAIGIQVHNKKAVVRRSPGRFLKEAIGVHVKIYISTGIHFNTITI